MKLNNPLIKIFYSYEEVQLFKLRFENPLRRELHLKSRKQAN